MSAYYGSRWGDPDRWGDPSEAPPSLRPPRAEWTRCRECGQEILTAGTPLCDVHFQQWLDRLAAARAAREAPCE